MTTPAPDTNSPLTMIHTVASRIQEACAKITDVCSQQLESNTQYSEDQARKEAAGLIRYVLENKKQLCDKYPLFAQIEIYNILIARWDGLQMNQKSDYYSGIEQLEREKRFKKLRKYSDKHLQEAVQPMSSEDRQVSADLQSNQERNPISKINSLEQTNEGSDTQEISRNAVEQPDRNIQSVGLHPIQEIEEQKSAIGVVIMPEETVEKCFQEGVENGSKIEFCGNIQECNEIIVVNPVEPIEGSNKKTDEQQNCNVALDLTDKSCQINIQTKKYQEIDELPHKSNQHDENPQMCSQSQTIQQQTMNDQSLKAENQSKNSPLENVSEQQEYKEEIIDLQSEINHTKAGKSSSQTENDNQGKTSKLPHENIDQPDSIPLVQATSNEILRQNNATPIQQEQKGHDIRPEIGSNSSKNGHPSQQQT